MWAMVWNEVRDYDAWRKAYDGCGDLFRKYGCTKQYLYRGVEDPNDVILALEFADRGSADCFFLDPQLQDLLRRGGSTKPPTFSFSEPAKAPAKV